jgi:hypothetical protein
MIVEDFRRPGSAHSRQTAGAAGTAGTAGTGVTLEPGRAGIACDPGRVNVPEGVL